MSLSMALGADWEEGIQKTGFLHVVDEERDENEKKKGRVEGFGEKKMAAVFHTVMKWSSNPKGAKGWNIYWSVTEQSASRKLS